MRYPTDEELLNFIEKLEAEPLFDPPHLKENILGEINKTASASMLPASGSRITWWQGNLFYNMKVMAGMAAALALIFIIPLDFNIECWQGQVNEQRIEIAKERYGSGQQDSESEFSRLYRIGTTAITDTNMLIIDRLNSFDGLFDTKGAANYESIKKE